MAKNIILHFGSHRFDLADITVEPVAFLYMLASFLYFPTFQSLIFDKVCIQEYNSSDFCQDLKVNETFKLNHTTEYHTISENTSHWILYANICLFIPSFLIVTLILGPLGDKMGRKFPIILPLIGILCCYLSGLVNASFISAPLYLMLIGPVVNGICGGYIAFIMAIYSYIGHIARPDTKMMRVGLVEAMIFLSGTLGIFISGMMLDHQGYVFVFSSILIITAVGLLYTAVWVDNVCHIVPGEDSGCLESVAKSVRGYRGCLGRSRQPGVLCCLVLMVATIDLIMLCTSGE